MIREVKIREGWYMVTNYGFSGSQVSIRFKKCNRNYRSSELEEPKWWFEDEWDVEVKSSEGLRIQMMTSSSGKVWHQGSGFEDREKSNGNKDFKEMRSLSCGYWKSLFNVSTMNEKKKHIFTQYCEILEHWGSGAGPQRLKRKKQVTQWDLIKIIGF